MHRFQVLGDFSDFGGKPEVTQRTPISPLCGATRQILWQILKGDQRLSISGQ